MTVRLQGHFALVGQAFVRRRWREVEGVGTSHPPRLTIEIAAAVVVEKLARLEEDVQLRE